MKEGTPPPSSNLYYTNEYGEVVGVSITRSNLRENFEFPKEGMEVAGTKGREYKAPKKEPKAPILSYELDSKEKITYWLRKFFLRKEDPTVNDANVLLNETPPSLQSFFIQKLEELVEETGRKLTRRKKKKKKGNKKIASKAKANKGKGQEKPSKAEQPKSMDYASTTRSTFGDIVKIVKKGRKPKYGYARDFFGRIQERDRYVEDRDVNPCSAANSLYDKEDDNSSAYDGWD